MGENGGKADKGKKEQKKKPKMTFRKNGKGSDHKISRY